MSVSVVPRMHFVCCPTLNSPSPRSSWSWQGNSSCRTEGKATPVEWRVRKRGSHRKVLGRVNRELSGEKTTRSSGSEGGSEIAVSFSRSKSFPFVCTMHSTVFSLAGFFIWSFFCPLCMCAYIDLQSTHTCESICPQLTSANPSPAPSRPSPRVLSHRDPVIR